MDVKLVYLLHAKENEAVAHEILSFFNNSNVELSSNPSASDLEQAIQQNPSTPILVLISDNFLRSLDAMDRLSVIIQEPSNYLVPVLIDGRKLREGTTDVYDSYPTKIGTIHEVMQYRDYWYEEWIRLRKACNNAVESEQEALEKKKNIAKRMSTNIGTFLRNINGLKPKTYEQFSKEDYQYFLDKIELETLQHQPSAEHLKVVKEEDQPEHTTEETPLVVDIQDQETEILDTEETVLPQEEPHAEDEQEEKVEILVENQEEKLSEENIETIDPNANGISIETEDLVESNPKEEVLVEEIKEPTEKLLVEDLTPPEEIETATEDAEGNNTEEEAQIPTVEEEEDFAEAPTPIDQEEEQENPVFAMRSLDDLDDFDEDAVYENVKIEEVNDLDVLFYLAESETEEADLDNAIHCYQRILELDPTNGRALLWLARLLGRVEADHNTEIADLYRKALFCNEESAVIYYEYALFLKNAYQSLHRAADLLHRSLELDPLFDLAYMELAVCQKELGQDALARANYLQACVLNESYQSAENDDSYGVLRPEPAEQEVQEEAVAEAATPHPNSEKVVMVTGASSGIGRAIAELFAFNGFKVIMTGRRKERLETIEKELKQQFEVNIQSLVFDVRDQKAVQAAIESLPEDWQQVDILINNAGLARGRSPIHQGALEHWETMIDTNIKGLLYLTRLVTPKMVENKKGFVINIGSIAGKEPYANGNVYCATKAAVDMLTRAMRLDLHSYGIRVAAIHPGHVETEFALVRFDGDEERAAIYDNFSPLTAYDVAEAVYFVASRPERVNIQDLSMFSTQQASATVIDQSGRKYE